MRPSTSSTATCSIGGLVSPTPTPGKPPDGRGARGPDPADPRPWPPAPAPMKTSPPHDETAPPQAPRPTGEGEEVEGGEERGGGGGGGGGRSRRGRAAAAARRAATAAGASRRGLGTGAGVVLPRFSFFGC